MRIAFGVTVALCGAMVIIGCAPTTLHNWGRYDHRLYQYYQDPEAVDALKEEIYQVIQASEESDAKVAPGLYAEYGYLLLEEGASSEAIEFFQKEKEEWPQSEVYMNRMIEASRDTETDLDDSPQAAQQGDEYE